MDKILEYLRHIVSDTGKGVKGYIRAQFILALITFGILCVGFIIIDISSPILKSFAISILDVIPVLGSGIIMIPWSILSFISGNKEVGTGIAVLYIILVISRQILEPKIMGREIGVRPIYTFVATIIGAILLGPAGMVIGPLVAVVIGSVIRTKKRLDK